MRWHVLIFEFFLCNLGTTNHSLQHCGNVFDVSIKNPREKFYVWMCIYISIPV